MQQTPHNTVREAYVYPIQVGEQGRIYMICVGLSPSEPTKGHQMLSSLCTFDVNFTILESYGFEGMLQPAERPLCP